MDNFTEILKLTNEILMGISFLVAIIAGTKWGKKNQIEKVKIETNLIQQYIEAAYHYVEQLEKTSGIKLENSIKNRTAIDKFLDLIPENITINLEGVVTKLEAYINTQHK